MHEIDDAPERAAALFERMAPGLPPPTAVRREPLTLAGVSTWGVRAQGGLAYRLKVAIDTRGAALVRRGAELLGLLTSRGVPVPSSVAVRAAAPGSDDAVALETRLGTSDARTAWHILGTEGRVALAEDMAHGLWLLHRLSVADLGPWGVPARGPVRPWRETLLGRIARQMDRLRDADRLPADLTAAYEARLCRHAEAVPDEVERRPVHGSFGLESVAVQRRAYTGMRDVEVAGAGDPWEDVATFLVSTGEPGAASTRRFLETYAGHVAPPPDVHTRLDLYEGLVLLRVLVRLCGEGMDAEWGGLEEATASYVSTPPLRWWW